MNEYIIFTDSACDVPATVLNEWNIPFTCLTFRFNGEDKEYGNNDMEIGEFYNRMREGGVAKTAAANTEAFGNAFEKILKDGHDILYIGFSTGLSTTYNSARIAAEELKDKYPDRKIITIDSLSASLGFGMLVYLAKKKKENGASIDECAEYIKSLVPKMCHWFTVDDLVYLMRGGRVSKTTAFVGNMLGIKPVLHMDNEGHLINVTKVRGRRSSLMALADKYGELRDESADNTIFISHGDCKKDADTLAEMIKTKYGSDVEFISEVGTVIGAHSGPGTLALFFIGKER